MWYAPYGSLRRPLSFLAPAIPSTEYVTAKMHAQRRAGADPDRPNLITDPITGSASTTGAGERDPRSSSFEAAVERGAVVAIPGTS